MPREHQESEHAMQHWTLTRAADGLARLTLDCAGGSTNTLGAPVLALLIEWFGWRGPYVALAIATSAALLVVRWRVAPGVAAEHAVAEEGAPRARLPRSAWAPMRSSSPATPMR